ncbi:MAG: cysteine--tRNA ligase [Thermoleophilia bacterium]|nr:cysteine--tRNA ligase [Thermoleophilia bacterium]
MKGPSCSTWWEDWGGVPFLAAWTRPRSTWPDTRKRAHPRTGARRPDTRRPILRLYDSMSQEKREFVPRDPGHVTMYFCGPTVYNLVHIGNARPFVVSMVAKRYFESLGYTVTLVENITDIDDRIILKAIDQGRAASEVAAEFAQAYRDDTDRLGLGRPDVEPLATEHIPEIIGLITDLVERGHAYQSGSDVYFDVDSFAEYGKLSKQQVAEMRHGARGAVGEDKDDPLDFALWKGAKPGEPAWDSPWGPGRPGWHIECSAMSMKYLGPGFDIHGGGRDLIFPHHENEIAQAEGALESPFVRFWMHNGMLNLSEEKMSKSLGNILTLRDVLDEHRPEALIAVFLGSHYRSPMEFSEDVLEEAEQQVDRLRNVFMELADQAAGGASAPSAGLVAQPGAATGLAAPILQKVAARQQAFADAMADDLNTAAGLAEVFGLAREANAALAAGELDVGTAAQVRTEMVEMVHVLGLDAVAGGDDCIPDEIEAMAEERQQCRARRDFARADELRTAIAECGYEVRDVPGGCKIVRAR